MRSSRARPPESGPDLNWTIWQLADSAFPTGGFAHSLGLEAAWQHGEVKSAGDLTGFVGISLRQLRRAAIPFVTATYQEPGRLGAIDRMFDAFTPNHVTNRASRKQGRAFLLAVRRIFPTVEACGVFAYADDPSSPAHFAPVFGAALSPLRIPRETVVRLFVFNQLRSLLAAAVRLNIVGPMEAQAIQNELTGLAEDISVGSLSLELADVAQIAPLLDVWQGAQDRLYSRLFQS